MTIKDLAHETGYSVGTISRVLNNHPNVSEKARIEILAAVERFGFERNKNAKNLKQSYGEGILAVVTGTSNELFSRMIERIQQALSQTRYPLTVDYVDENADPVVKALQLSREKKPEGLLFLGGDARLYERSYGQIQLPGVVLTTDVSSLHMPNLSSVSTDDVSAAECVMDHLIANGHRDIGIISGDRSCSGPSRLRWEGCLRAAARHGLSLPEAHCATARYTLKDGYTAALRLMQHPPLTAIFAMSDIMAFGAICALHDRGLRVPEDISVVGFDGLDMCSYYTPKLTTIQQSVVRIADRGVRLLLDHIEKQTPARHEIISFSLCEGESVASLLRQRTETTTESDTL